MIVFCNLFFCFFYIGAAFSQLLLEENPDNLRTQEAMIFKNCNKDMDNIIIYDDLKTMYPRFFQQLHDQFHSIIVDNNRHMTLVTKVDAILITVSASVSVQKIFKKIYKMVEGNAMIPVYIINIPNNSCESVIKMMKRLWNNNVLTSYSFCIDENNNIEIITYNPISKRAPTEWTASNRYRNSRFYKRIYHPGTKCQELDFDRTKYLDGYDIVIGIPIYTEESLPLKSNIISYNELKENESLISKSDSGILNAFVTRFNVTLKLQLFPMTGKSDKEMKCNPIDEYLTTKLMLLKGDKISSVKNFCSQTDSLWQICNHLDECFLLDTQFYTRTYPLAWRTIGIATYNRGSKTIGEKFWDFYGIWTVLFTIFTLLITFVVIWLSENRKTAFAIFEIIRLLISHNLHTRINTLSLRIFFISVFIYFLIIQATFNGHIAKFLTKPESKKQAEMKEDLKALGYTSDQIYYAKNVSDKLAENFAEMTINTFQAKKCVNHILNKEINAACVLDHASLLYYAKRNNKLHVSKKPSDEQFDGFWIYKEWPLAKCINFFFILLEDHGLRKLWSDNDPIYTSIRNLTAAEIEWDGNFHPIKLENLVFSFWILFVGMVSAAISFSIEMLTSKKSKCDLSNRNPLIKSSSDVHNMVNILDRFFCDK